MISIIMPTYNRGYIIEEAINSVKSQTYEDYELIIVDDGSTDNTRKIVQKNQSKKIKYYYLKENKGANHARNYGINMAEGELLAFLDTDNEWDKTFLEKRYQRLLCDEADLVFGRVKILDKEELLVWPKNEKEELLSKENILKIMFYGNLIDTNTVLLRRKCYEKISGFDEKLKRFQDWDFFFRVLLDDDFKVCFSDDILVNSKVQKNSISRQKDLYWEARLRIFEKYISQCREKGYVYDVVYYLINSSDKCEMTDEIQMHILKILDTQDFLGIFPKLKKMDISINELMVELEKVTKDDDITFQKNNLIMELLQKWLLKSKNGWSIEKILSENKIEKIAIYGYGVLGKTLYYMLKNTEINVVYIIDKDIRKMQEEIEEEKIIMDLSKFGSLQQVDAIIVTAILCFNELRNKLEQYIQIPIISIERIINSNII